ncbi:sulfoxide reductase heme-binding subunit YedZ [Rhodovulum sulfidophilum]|uniref:Sulfoxide reductase heme-binding subunit YedZ n=1 Tax=Rhodovulum sulfidophilum TaxID=35806 RepID=A0A0D6B5R0_RHOSU|nr:sulfoxide reductase heme-binding subunit YedZ [Rhodovulum sulfidophilum]
MLVHPDIGIGEAHLFQYLPDGHTGLGEGQRRASSIDLAVPLGGLHFVMQSKGWQMEPLVYLAAILGLLALRFRSSRGRVAT